MFKNAEIKADFSAKGLKEASERLDEMKLNEKDAKEYKKYLKDLRDIASEQHTKMADAQELINQGINKGKEERDSEIDMRIKSKGLNYEEISDFTGLTIEKVRQIIENQANK